MAYTLRYSPAGSSRFSWFPRGVKWLLILNTALFVVYFFALRAGYGALFHDFGLIPRAVVGQLALWQLVTYLFLHDPTGFGHILFNMLTLWMFGADLERTWGMRRFLRYYFLCGVGAGVCVVVANLLFGNMDSRTIGASGAIYGLLLAFGMLYPDTTVFFNFLFPIKAKYFVMIIGAIAFLSSIGASGGSVSHIAHLGGMVFGYLHLKSNFLVKSNLISIMAAKYYGWRRRRARRKFDVYLRKHDSGRDRYIH